MADDFLSRWSRRKSASEDAADPPSAAHAPPHADAPAQPSEEGDDAAILARLGLNHPDEMRPGDDFAAFLNAAVPRHLKRLALRRLWRTDPKLACLDGLNDYDTDFRGGGVAAGSLRTSYEVGRGLVRRMAETGDQVASSPQTSPAASAGDDAPGADARTAGAGTTEGGPAEPKEARAATDRAPHEPPVERTTRRMVFRPPEGSRG